ncbi:MAG: hypothetical protein Fur0044_39730 [Anaerolineae bacterium]
MGKICISGYSNGKPNAWAAGYFFEEDLCYNVDDEGRLGRLVGRGGILQALSQNLSSK